MLVYKKIKDKKKGGGGGRNEPVYKCYLAFFKNRWKIL